MAMESVNPYEEYENDIKKAYQEGVTVEEAERLAAKFLHAQLQVGAQLRIVDLDARMRKSGLKAIKASAYLQEVGRAEKKPTEAMLEALVNTSLSVRTAQDALDSADVTREELANYLNVFREAHLYFRSIMKGTFGG